MGASELEERFDVLGTELLGLTRSRQTMPLASWRRRVKPSDILAVGTAPEDFNAMTRALDLSWLVPAGKEIAAMERQMQVWSKPWFHPTD